MAVALAAQMAVEAAQMAAEAVRVAVETARVGVEGVQAIARETRAAGGKVPETRHPMVSLETVTEIAVVIETEIANGAVAGMKAAGAIEIGTGVAKIAGAMNVTVATSFIPAARTLTLTTTTTAIARTDMTPAIATVFTPERRTRAEVRFTIRSAHISIRTDAAVFFLSLAAPLITPRRIATAS